MPSTKNSKVTLTASAAYGYGGKQFVARITGRHPKFVFEREFLGRKEGKRGEVSSVVVDDPGLYQERDIDRKAGTCDTYVVVFRVPSTSEVDYITVSLSEAMDLAKLTTAEIEASGLRREIERLEKVQADAAKKDHAEEIEAKASYPGGVTEGTRYPRHVIMAGRAARIRQLRGESEAVAAPASARDEAIAAVRALMQSHGLTVADLG